MGSYQDRGPFYSFRNPKHQKLCGLEFLKITGVFLLVCFYFYKDFTDSTIYVAVKAAEDERSVQTLR